jgi:hypothetical protein
LEATLEYRSVDDRLTGSSSVLEVIRAYCNLPVIFKVKKWLSHKSLYKKACVL